MTQQAKGTFNVNLTPQADEMPDGLQFGRLLIDKTFNGDIEGKSWGQMISAHTAVETSAAYSAIEFVEGSVNGKRGKFALQHTGVMSGGGSSLTISVVPDSGTDELASLSGTMTIDNVDGTHHYVFTYEIDGGPVGLSLG